MSPPVSPTCATLSWTLRRWRLPMPASRPAADLFSRCLAERPPPIPLERWLNPSLADILANDPLQILGMARAITRIRHALVTGQRIRIVTDYDVDGTTSSLILQHALRAVCPDPANLQLSWHIPDRFDEGYGLSLRTAQRAVADGIHLILTADIGVRDHAPVSTAAAAGVDVIICDHHLPDGETVPADAYAVLCPPQKGCPYPNKALAACGVSLKLAQALLQDDPRQERFLRSFTKLAAIGTVADVVDLSTPENRAIVAEGLRELSKGPHSPGLSALLTEAGIRPGQKLEAWQLGFYVGPRINAAGRLESAGAVVDLINEKDPEIARKRAASLGELNRERQQIQKRAEAEALAQVPSPLPAFVVVAGEEDPTGQERPWHRGIVGIVAGRLRDKLHRPVAVVALSGASGRGSIRSIPGVHAVAALEACRHLLTRFGGHPVAAGFDVPRENLDNFAQAIAAWTAQMADADLFTPEDTVDAVAHPREITVEAIENLSRLGPFGKGNEEPLFLIEGVLLENVRTVGEGHLQFRLQGAKGIWFRAPPLPLGWERQPVDLLVSLGIDEWQGQRNPSLKVRDMRPASLPPS
jgi:single-stranded-DNA-specific exonuclease